LEKFARNLPTAEILQKTFGKRFIEALHAMKPEDARVLLGETFVEDDVEGMKRAVVHKIATNMRAEIERHQKVTLARPEPSRAGGGGGGAHAARQAGGRGSSYRHEYLSDATRERAKKFAGIRKTYTLKGFSSGRTALKNAQAQLLNPNPDAHDTKKNIARFFSRRGKPKSRKGRGRKSIAGKGTTLGPDSAPGSGNMRWGNPF